MTRHRILRLLPLFIMSGIIFSFSLQVAEVSNEQSGFIVAIVTKILVPLVGNTFSIDTLTYVVRKCAHFSEYALLGILGAYANMGWNRKYTKLFIGYGVINAVLDETIQYFVPGRSCQLSDMVLDSIGYFCGFLFVLFVYKYFVKGEKAND